MYFIPGYVCKEKSKNGVYLTSKLKENQIQIETKVEEDSIAELKNGCVQIDTPVKKFLYEQEMLLSSEMFNDTVRQLICAFNKTMILTLMPTEACNFRCPYCYENHQAITMDNHVIEAIKNFIQEQKGIQKLKINWFGGEPTLCPQIIEEINTAAMKNFDINKDEFRSFMTTNGFLLTKEAFIKYYNLGIRTYQITLDGWAHDSTRYLASGAPTLETILNNLKEIKKLPKEYEFNIILRYNILENNQDVSWYDYMKELFGDDDRYHLMVFAVGDWGGESVRSLALLNNDKEKNEVLRFHREYIQKIGFKPVPNYRNGIGGEMCHAAYKNGFVIRADGRVQKCTVALENPMNDVGYIDTNHNIIISNDKNYRWYEPALKYSCYTCEKVLECLNQRCPYSRLRTNNTKICENEMERLL